MVTPLSKTSMTVASDGAKAKPRGRRKAQASATTTIRDLVSYRLSRTATLMSRGAALRYRRQFGVSLGEWRALALLAGPPMTVMELTRAAGLDKAQMSRVVSSLTERDLVRREVLPSDSRVGVLSLTPSGREIYTGLIAAANERDRAFRAALTADELTMLETVLDKLAEAARNFIKAEAEDQPVRANA